MKQYMITFRSITFAQRGERSLGKRGISCTVGRTPKWMEQQGCGYGVTLRTANLYRAVEILREAGAGRVDFTVGSALDLFGGSLPYEYLKRFSGTPSP